MSQSLPLPLPLRVLVKGASTVNWVSWMGGPRDDFTFPRAIEAQLLADGQPCDVRTITMPSERTSTILNTWQREVLGFSPDVIVLVYGHYETIHLFLPRWLERHVNSLRAKPRRAGRLYRRLVLRPSWMALARLQAKIDSTIDPTVRRHRPKQVAADLEQYITHVQKVGSPLVVLFELLPPTGKYISWFPGMATRMKVMNETIADLVERIARPNVRYFRVSELVDEHFGGDLELAASDGFHYTPELHRLIGAALGREIEEWVQTQTHLVQGARPS
ncbi:SGNH/GDSL hydrolase family protein [Aeromicrobium sp.]|uniref:SGNH/GDSL hydrolase family protein n=1 Tax=Aeromicrobium sp. TaxID=1871063 RepID=UPI0019A9D84F|nr:SGNH/GDSL hydrolase family protein [Aeromicrobium sp.]MBC7631694.1 SGNH/GDSL hydrolase family protein [Aeromicrobium sp.]